MSCSCRPDAPELVGRDPVALRHQADGDEPLPDREVRPVEERSGGDAELVAARVAVPPAARLEPEQAAGLVAARAFDGLRPAERLQVPARACLQRVALRAGRRRWKLRGQGAAQRGNVTRALVGFKRALTAPLRRLPRPGRRPPPRDLHRVHSFLLGSFCHSPSHAARSGGVTKWWPGGVDVVEPIAPPAFRSLRQLPSGGLSRGCRRSLGSRVHRARSASRSKSSPGAVRGRPQGRRAKGQWRRWTKAPPAR